MTKKKRYKDPFAAREAEKYENPIPSREFLLDHIKNHGGPVKYRRLASELGLVEDQCEALRRRLRAMERDHQLLRNRDGAYGVMTNMGLVKGRFSAHRDGFGFVVPEEGGDDLYINAREARAVFHDDEVLVRVAGQDFKGRREGVIVEVLKRNTEEVVGRFFEESGVGFVEPAGKRIKKDILIPPEHYKGVKNGQFVVVHIEHQPTRHSQAIGKITEVLGEHMAPGMEIDVAIRGYQLPNEWSQEVEAELAKLPDEIQESDFKGRKDLRDLPFVTIDGEDSKDFDDAVFCQPNKKGGWRLCVAIADVSHYVQVGSALDQAAYLRGNSVYFPARVIPMLPEKLSNHLCSVNPKVDRLCMVADMIVAASGAVSRSQFYPAVMHSHARLTYTQVGAFLENDEKTLPDGIDETINNLFELYKILQKTREKRGAMDLDMVETQIVFGENKKIEKIVPTTRNVAHKLIEECMLCANVAAANYVEKNKLLNLFRVHESPNSEKIDKLKLFLGELGVQFTTAEEPSPKDYANVLDAIKDRPDRHIITMVLLRTMSQAKYSPENKGHFGLSFKSYAHFTSPIRRYPDLILHRAIRANLEGKKIYEDFNDMQAMGEHCSGTERRADEATRDVVDWLKCEYMIDKVGQEFDGVIASVTSFGFFVELKDIYVEGLVHINTLKNDFYHFDAMRHVLAGEHTGKRFQLGDVVRIRVDRVDLDDRHIDFAYLEEEVPHGKK